MMNEQTSENKLSKEVVDFLNQEVNSLTDQEYNALGKILQHHKGEVTLEDAKTALWVVQNPEEAEKEMYRQSTASYFR